MSTSGKRKDKPKWKAANTDIIQISGVRNFPNWADEVDNEDEEFDTKLMVLPTAPRSSCMVAVDESKIPTNPPFQAHVSNLPYELTEEELRDLFPQSSVKEVRIPKEERGNRARGYGYVEFDDRNSLITALHKGELSVKGRSVRIELATSDSGRGGGRSRGNQRNDSGSMNSSSIDRTASNWRSGPRDETEDRDRGGPRRDYGHGGGNFSRRDDGFDRDRRDERYGNRDRGFRDDDRRSRNDDWGSDRRREYNRGGERDRRDERDRNDPPPPRSDHHSEPKNRPKLNLQPRSTNLPPPAASSSEATTSASIFGNAKPVDTSAKLREIEERLANESITDKSRSGGSSTGSSSGARPGSGPPPSAPSSAPPSDIAAKEKKLEPAQPPKENAWGKSRLHHQEKKSLRPDENKDI